MNWKTPQERDNLDLLELVCQLHSRALNNPSKEMHDSYLEARTELEKRLSQPSTPQEDFRQMDLLNKSAYLFKIMIRSGEIKNIEAEEWLSEYENGKPSTPQRAEEVYKQSARAVLYKYWAEWAEGLFQDFKATHENFKENFDQVIKIPSLNKLIQKAQAEFNKYIRTRDRDKGCISSGGPVEQAGHYYNAGQYTALRFNEDNVHGQSLQDNYFKSGNLIHYRQGLLKRIGQQRLDLLDSSARNRIKKWTRLELEVVYNHYKKLNEIQAKQMQPMMLNYFFNP